ncbi:hypothetical protein JGY85_04260 [Shigella sonnei]|nr:hypothetical protein [Shigella sonnei]
MSQTTIIINGFGCQGIGILLDGNPPHAEVCNRRRVKLQSWIAPKWPLFAHERDAARRGDNGAQPGLQIPPILAVAKRVCTLLSGQSQ